MGQTAFISREPIVVVRCVSCGLGQLVVGPNDANAVFDEVYTAPADAHRLTLDRYGELLTDLERFRTGRSLLEIGFGQGSLLRRARAHGWQVIGTETSGVVTQRLASEGFEVRLGEDAAATVEPGSCDVVVMLEVLEHVADFRRTLDQARAALRQGGALLLSTPNADSLTRRIISSRWRVFAPEHRWYFTPTSMRRALNAAGFAVKRMRSQNVYPPEIWSALRHGGSKSCISCASAGASTLRDFSRRSPIGRALRRLVNAGLTATGSGDTLWVLAIRR